MQHLPTTLASVADDPHPALSRRERVLGAFRID
jgi:hypothetical protein